MDPLEPQEALRRAMRAMADGHWENGSLEGAQTNALESVAWSLMGILAASTGTMDESTPLRKKLDEVALVGLRR